MKNFCFYLLPVLLGLGILSHSNAQENPVVFTVAKDTINLKEFKYIYEKNNSNDDDIYSEESVRDYLELYTNFKLKVMAAREAGLDTTQKYLNEFKDYRQQLSEPYLRDTAKLNELMREAYQRMQEERNVSHILIKVPEGAPPKDTIEAYNKAMELYNKLNSGESSFEAVAKRHSEDKHTKNDGGELGYFSVFDMVYPFENAAYQLSVGETSKPVRTRHGYHILKLNDKRAYRGHIKTAHIMIQADQTKEENWKAARQKIDSIYRALEDGANFGMMARRHSDDKRSRQNQGKMPEFSSLSRQLPAKFRDEAFALEEDNEISKPFHTQYGWHILKRIEKRGVEPFDKVRDKLKKQLKKSDRYQLIKESVIEKIKKENDFKFYEDHLAQFKAKVDTSLLNGNWEAGSEVMKTVSLFEIGDQEFTQKDFAQYLEKAQKKGEYQFLDYAVHQYFLDFQQNRLMTYERDRLPEKYPKFRNLLTEYKEGILLFEITDQKVWSKAIQDSAGLKAYYENNNGQYKKPERKKASIVSCEGKQAAKSLQKMAKKGDENLSKAYGQMDATSHEQCELREGMFTDEDEKAIKRAKDKPGLFRVRAGKKHHVVQVKEVIPEGVPPLSKIRGKVIADYQNHLEQEWIEELKSQYPVKVNDEAVESLVKE